MLSSPIQDRSTNSVDNFESLIEFYILPNSIFKKEKRVGPKGGPVERFVASVEIEDHQGDVVSVEAIAKEMETFKEIGANFQGLHTNYPAGYMLDWGFCKVNDTIGVWMDIEFYTKYKSQREFYERTKLPWGHDEKIAGVSLGGKTLERERKCDQNKCWNHIKKLELWELSGVKEPANPLARKVLENGTLEGLGHKVQFFSKDEFTEQMEESTISVSEQKQDLSTNSMQKQGRSCGGQFLSKGETCSCENCSHHGFTKAKCPECGGKMVDGVCKDCGYKAKGDNEEEDETEEKPEEPEGGTPGEEKNTSEESPSDNNNEQETYPEEERMESEEGEEEMNGNGQIQEVSQKLDTMMEALNIDKSTLVKALAVENDSQQTSGNNEIESRLDSLEKSLNKIARAVGEPEPEKTIEHEGHTYVLKSDGDGETEEEEEEEESEVEKLQKQLNEALRKMKEIEETGTYRNVQAVDPTGPSDEDENLNKNLQGQGQTWEPNLSLFKGKHLDRVEASKDPYGYYEPKASIDDLEAVQRMEKARNATQPPLEEAGYIMQ